MLRGGSVTIFGDGSPRRGCVHVEDAVKGALRAASGTPATCLIGTGIVTSTQMIFDALARLTGYEREAEYEPQCPGDIQRIYLDSPCAQQEWG